MQHFSQIAPRVCTLVLFITTSQNGKLGHSCVRVTKSRLYDSQVRDHVIVHLDINVSSSFHNCVCVVNGGNAMAAVLSIIIFSLYQLSVLFMVIKL